MGVMNCTMGRRTPAGWALLAAALVVTVPAPGAPPAVVTSELSDFDPARALSGVPVTLSRIGAEGDFTRGITPSVGGARLPAQVDVLRHAPDGSIRHALVSFVLPKQAPGGPVRIDWLNEPPPDPPPFAWGFDPAALAPRLLLAPDGGASLVSDLGRILGGRWAASDRVSVLHDGPVMKEIEVRDVPVAADGTPDARIEVFWRLRAFTGQRSVRVEAVVENCRDRVKGAKHAVQYKFESVELTVGGRPLFREGPFDHMDQTRYRILAWTDGPIEDLHRRPDYDYWVRGRFVPLYRWTSPMTPEKVDATFTRPSDDRRALQRRQGILESGILHRHMPGTGGRWEMNPYPSWIPAYLMSGAPGLYRAILHADGNGGGAFYIHVRQDGAPGYNVFTVRQPPLDTGYRIELYRLPDGGRPAVQPDHAHAPSLGYFSYLLTGDRFYAEELSFWASYQLGEWPHKGLRWQALERAFAWSLRQVADAAFILPGGHPLQPYFVQGVDRCLDEMTEGLVRSGRRVHSPPAGSWQGSGRPFWVNARYGSAWQYAWVVWSLGNAVDKGFPKAAAVRDWTAEYIVGLYTSDDEYRAPDGTAFRYDPRDAMTYSTAIERLETRIVTNRQGRRGLEIVRSLGPIENYGEVWYLTKMNEDNAWTSQTGLGTEPGPGGHWPLRADGWGHGRTWDVTKGQSRPAYSWHRYGAWPALVTALEAGIPRAQEAWRIMTGLAGPKGEYDMEMVPRRGLPAPAGR
jgi:hypothetical protein